MWLEFFASFQRAGLVSDQHLVKVRLVEGEEVMRPLWLLRVGRPLHRKCSTGNKCQRVRSPVLHSRQVFGGSAQTKPLSGTHVWESVPIQKWLHKYLIMSVALSEKHTSRERLGLLRKERRYYF